MSIELIRYEGGQIKLRIEAGEGCLRPASTITSECGVEPECAFLLLEVELEDPRQHREAR